MKINKVVKSADFVTEREVYVTPRLHQLGHRIKRERFVGAALTNKHDTTQFSRTVNRTASAKKQTRPNSRADSWAVGRGLVSIFARSGLPN